MHTLALALHAVRAGAAVHSATVARVALNSGPATAAQCIRLANACPDSAIKVPGGGIAVAVGLQPVLVQPVVEVQLGYSATCGVRCCNTC
jgi:hypothetical protein